MISGASEEELIEAIGRADVLLEFMPKIKQLQQENKKLNGAIQTYDILLKANTEENKQLKDNWNKLKKWIYEEHYLYIPGIARNSTYQVVLDKMQELQGSDSDE